MFTKLLFAMVPMVLVLAITGGAAPEAVAQVDAAPAPEVGGCRYFCENDPTPHLTRAACQAVCSTLCEPIC